MTSQAIIDTHFHFIYRDRLSYPWLKGVAARYAEEALRCGITDALHMEADVAEADIEAETRNVEDLAVQKPNLLRGAISSCRPERADCTFPLADDAPISLQSKKTEFLAIEVDDSRLPGIAVPVMAAQ